jgi:hypothetical protein
MPRSRRKDWRQCSTATVCKYAGYAHSLAAAYAIVDHETTEERFADAELHRLRGDLLSATDDRAVAEQNHH